MIEIVDIKIMAKEGHVHLRRDRRFLPYLSQLRQDDGLVCSVESLSLSAEGGGYHGAIDGLDVRNFLQDHGPVVFIFRVGIDWVALEEDILQIGELGALGDLVNALDDIVRNVESV